MNIAKNEDDSLISKSCNTLKAFSSPCSCGELAVPIGIQGDEYRCISCSEIHRNIKYNFERGNLQSSQNKSLVSHQFLDMDYYGAAVNLLKKENKNWSRPESKFKRILNRLLS